MKSIPLNMPGNRASTRAIVDDEDFEYLSKIKWRVSYAGYASSPKYIGRESGSPRSTCVMMHRIIMKAEKGSSLDHINGNKLDNRKENLRFASPSQNIHNRDKTRLNKSGFKGVIKKGNKWVAHIGIGGRGGSRIYLGTFDSPELAGQAYNTAANSLHGEFAFLNRASATPTRYN